ncbi:carbon-nitrogen hydrolase family protein [Spirosoma jeollabukense]
MKIGVAQIRPVKGDVQRNIDAHKKLVELAVFNGADMLIFPELSITGYEPELAKTLATTSDDSRFAVLQAHSDTNHMTIGVGMPTESESGIQISLLIFQPNTPRQTYSKQYLHADEEPYFVSGQQAVFLTINNTKIALAICYELSVSEHAQNAFESGAAVYIASVAKSADGVEKASKRLAAIASTYSMTVLMANCVGHCDNFDSAGNSSIWNDKGALMGHLNDTTEGILLIDTDTQELQSA